MSGTVAPGFEPVQQLLEGFAAEDPAYSAQLNVLWRGSEIVDLVVGDEFEPDSLTGIFSTSKGLSALTLALLVDRGQLDLDQTVAHYWPEFAAAGKAGILVRELLSHQAGLVGVKGLTIDEIIDSAPAAEKLAAATPLWRPGSMFGYHALTVGVFMEELARRITGGSLQELYEAEIRQGADAYLGLPEELEPRYVPLVFRPPDDLTPFADMLPDDFGALSVTGLLTGVDFASFPNDRRVRAAGVSAAGGVASARGLAQVFENAPKLVKPATMTAMTQRQVWGTDVNLGEEFSFAIVFQRPARSMPFGSLEAFGHDGAGGTLAFADPLYDLAFAYNRAPMRPPIGPEEKAVALSIALRKCVIAKLQA